MQPADSKFEKLFSSGDEAVARKVTIQRHLPEAHHEANLQAFALGTGGGNR